jgi:hypothetical protein
MKISGNPGCGANAVCRGFRHQLMRGNRTVKIDTGSLVDILWISILAKKLTDKFLFP